MSVIVALMGLVVNEGAEFTRLLRGSTPSGEYPAFDMITQCSGKSRIFVWNMAVRSHVRFSTRLLQGSSSCDVVVRYTGLTKHHTILVLKLQATFCISEMSSRSLGSALAAAVGDDQSIIVQSAGWGEFRRRDGSPRSSIG